MADSVKIRITGDDSAFLETLRSVDAAVRTTLDGLTGATAAAAEAWSASVRGVGLALREALLGSGDGADAGDGASVAAALGSAMANAWSTAVLNAPVWAELDISALLIRAFAGRPEALAGAAEALRATLNEGVLRPGVAGADWQGLAALVATRLLWTALAGVGALLSAQPMFNGAASAAVSGVGAAMNASAVAASSGSSTANGWIRGFNSRVGAMKSAARAAARAITAAFNAAMGISSPSKEFMRSGRYTGEGFILGYEKSIREAQRTVRSLTGSLIGAANLPARAAAAPAQTDAARAAGEEASLPLNVGLYISDRKIAEATADANDRVSNARAKRVAAGWGIRT